MRKNVVDFRTKEQKRAEFKEKIVSKAMAATEWCSNNKEMLVFITAGMGFVTTAIKAVSRRRTLRKNEDLKTKYCYDRSLGHYWQLKRRLKTSEWGEIERRKRNGESLFDILSDMKVLK